MHIFKSAFVWTITWLSTRWFCASFSLFFLVVSSATKRSQHKYRKFFFFFIASHIVPLFVSWSEVGWPRWRLSFKLLDTLDFSLSFLPYSHILSSCFKHTWIYCQSHEKKNQAFKIQIDSLSDTGYSFEYVPTPPSCWRCRHRII